AHHHEVRGLASSAAALEQPLLGKFLKASACCAGFPYDEEVALAEALLAHPDEQARSWAERRLREHSAGLESRAAAAADLLRNATEGVPYGPRGVGNALRGVPELRVGLVEQLRSQPDPASPDLELCQSLLASHDPPEQVAEQFARFGSADSDFLARLDE